MRLSYVSRPAAGPRPGGLACAACDGSRVMAIDAVSILQSAIPRPGFMLSLCILRPAEAYLLALGLFRDYAGHGRMSISMLWVRGAKTNWAFARQHQIFNSFVRLSRDSRFNSIAASLWTESLIISLSYSSSSRSLESLF